MIAIIDAYGRVRFIDSKFTPRRGDRVDVGYDPMPMVNKVVMYPMPDRLARYGIDTKADVLVFVS